MRKLIIAFALAFMLIVPLAAAKTALYITKDNCARLGCDCLTGNDKLYCDRIKGLGYDVIINAEGDANDLSANWVADSKKADAIFMGDSSDTMLNKTQSVFCSHVAAAGKKVFVTGTNALKTNATEGCAFKLGRVSYGDVDNTCNSGFVFVKSSSYITKIYPIESSVKVYNEAGAMGVSSSSSEIAVNCDPAGNVYKTGSYSVLETNVKGTFWGLNAGSLSDDGWALFDRAFIYTMNDSVWSMATKTIPAHVSSGESFMVASRIYDRGQAVATGNVTLAINNVPSGNLAYNANSGHWEVIRDGITSNSTIRVVALEGSDQLTLNAGTISVKITSGSYQPGNYTLRATVSEDSGVTYKVWDSKLAIKREGSMEKVGGAYQATVALGDWGNLIIEVDAVSGGKEGGAMKQVAKGEATAFGTDYSIKPAVWVASATKEGTVSQKFMISSLNKPLSNVKARISSSISGKMDVNTTGMKNNLAVGEETSFTGTISTSSLYEGEYTGSIIVDSDETYYLIPVNLSFSKMTGNFIDVSPTEWSVVVGAGQETTGVFKLKNLATIPASGLTYTFTGDITDMIIVPEEPYYVPALGTADLAIKAQGVSEGAYEGEIAIASSVGSSKIRAVVRVTKDIFSLANQALGELDSVDSKLASIGNPVQLASRSQDLREKMQGVQESWNSKEFASAEAAYNAAVPELTSLKEDVDTVVNQPPYALIAVVIIIIIAAAGGFFFLRKSMKKKAEEKPKKEEKYEAPEEGEYRKEYY